MCVAPSHRDTWSSPSQPPCGTMPMTKYRGHSLSNLGGTLTFKPLAAEVLRFCAYLTQGHCLALGLCSLSNHFLSRTSTALPVMHQRKFVVRP